MRLTPIRTLIALVVALLAVRHSALAQDGATVATPPSFFGVAWAGPAASSAALNGKTVVVITYVTWCPKCNAWAGEVFAQVKQVIADKPVVVVTVSTDTPPAQALQYMQKKDFLGPNIFHGHDPTIAKRFGFTNEFFNYAVVNPEGKITHSGNAGSFYDDGKEPKFVIARKLFEIQDLGSFRMLKPEMSATLKQRLWPVELGVSQSLNRDLKKLEKGLSAEDRGLLRQTVKDYVDVELTELEALSESKEVTDKLAALEKATFLNSQFANTPAGKRAKELLAEFQKDTQLKQEALAKRQYELTMKITDEDRRAKALQLLSKKFADTYYGKQAVEAAQATAR
jgi:hypothetical protein